MKPAVYIGRIKYLHVRFLSHKVQVALAAFAAASSCLVEQLLVNVGGRWSLDTTSLECNCAVAAADQAPDTFMLTMCSKPFQRLIEVQSS